MKSRRDHYTRYSKVAVGNSKPRHVNAQRATHVIVIDDDNSSPATSRKRRRDTKRAMDSRRLPRTQHAKVRSYKTHHEKHRLEIREIDRPPTNPQSLASDLTEWLELFKANKSAPYVHNRPVSYVDGYSKKSWLSSTPDAAGRDTFSALWASDHHGKNTWIALFSMPVRNWVGNSDWDKDEWHAWGIALIKSQEGRGKHLVIWDCDPRSPFSQAKRPLRPDEFMLPTQVKLIYHARKRGELAGLWYNTDRSYAGQNRCLEFTLNWIKKMASHGDSPLAESDIRLQGCEKIIKK